MATLTIVFQGEAASLLNYISLSNNTTVRPPSGSVSFSSDVSFIAVNARTGWSGTVYWDPDGSGNDLTTIATVSNGAVTMDSSYTVSCRDRTIYIVVERDSSTTYTITVNANGGSYDGSTVTVSSSYPYLSLTNISNNTSRDGYKLTGWLWSVDGVVYTTGATITGISSSGTLTAQWEKTSFTITLNANGGIFTDTRLSTRSVPNRAAGSVFYFTSYSALVTRDGYKIIGWSASSTAITPTYEANGYVSVGYTDATYYAVWQKSVATITLYGNGGLWGGNLQKRTLTKNVGETVSFAEYGPNGTPPLLNAYHTLSGWSTSATGTAAWDADGYVTVGATDADYYAIWKNHIDPFYWDGGNGTKDSSIIATGLPVANITAERWNRLKAKVKEISTAKGVTYSYTEVSKGDAITSTEYNGVRNAIYNVPGHGTLPPAKARNTQILASLFNGTQSLKSALNAAIISYNNS